MSAPASWRFTPESTRGAERLEGLPAEVCAAFNGAMEWGAARGWWNPHDGSGTDWQGAFVYLLDIAGEMESEGFTPRKASDVLEWIEPEGAE